MNKVCFYIMKHDTGFAPNPFHGVCTLAACPPNHMKYRPLLSPGDVIAGVFRSGQSPRLVYSMEIENELGLDSYYRDPRFQCKKPRIHGDWRARAGDNIYYRNGKGHWLQDENAGFHKKGEEDDEWRKDVCGNRVYMGRRFVYLGENAVLLPRKLWTYLPPSQGISYLKADSYKRDYEHCRSWIAQMGSGVKGKPRDRNDKACESC